MTECLGDVTAYYLFVPKFNNWCIGLASFNQPEKIRVFSGKLNKYFNEELKFVRSLL